MATVAKPDGGTMTEHSAEKGAGPEGRVSDRTENEAMPREVYIVQWSNEPMPKEQWSGDRFWPFVEVYVAWHVALRRWGDLRDSGFPARMGPPEAVRTTRVLPPGKPNGQ